VSEDTGCPSRERLDEQTLVVFTSDNGRGWPRGEHGGSAGPLREGKAQRLRGHAVTGIARWPDTFPRAGRSARQL
jgi:arylsulfatase A-like enzyme